MKTIVIYKSKTGFVKKYAGWIADELSADLLEASKVNSVILESYDNIIFGGGLYAVGINGVKLITKNLDKLEGKKIVVFASGATPPRNEDVEKVRNSNFTTEQQKKVKFFYLRGGFNYDKLNMIDKILMSLLKLKLRNKKNLTADDRGMLAAYNNPVDFTDRKNIEDILMYINS